MARSKEIKYDVHVRGGDRWTVYTDAPSKLAAIAEAKKLLASRKFEAVKVTEERGQRAEILVYEEEGTLTEKAATIVPQSEAPRCEALEELYAYPARKTIGRLLRRYLDEAMLTPIELIHDFGHIRTFLHNDELYLQALHNISNLQTKGTDEKPLDRLNFLERTVKQMRERAQFMEDPEENKKLLKQKGLAAVIKKAGDAVEEAERDFTVRAAIAARIAEAQDWESKLVILLDMVAEDADGETIAFVDEVIAEILDSATAVQEILGYQRNLARAMRTMIQICVGEYDLGKDSDSPLEHASDLMARHDMPLTQGIMQDRVARALGGISPLTKGDRAEQQDAFKELVFDLVSNKLMANSGRLAEAATLRAKSVMTEEFADESSEQAIDDVMGLLPTEAARFSYLLDLCGTEFGAKNQDHVIGWLARTVDGMKSVTSIVDPGGSEADILAAAAGMRDRLLSTDLPDKWRLRFAKNIYDLLLDYSKSGGIPSSPAEVPAEANAGSEATAPAEPPPPPPKRKPGKGLSKKPLGRETIAAGEYIFREGEEGDAAFLILSGNVEIRRNLEAQEVVIATVGPGSIIGEMALIDSEPRMASVKTLTETEVTVIPAEELEIRLKRLEKFDPVMRRLVGMFVQRMRDYKVINVES